MDESSQQTLTNRLTAPVKAIVASRHADLLPLLQSGPGMAAQTALRDDACVRKIATFCYPLLPGLVRLAVKEQVFVDFVLDNREKLLAPLSAPTAAIAPSP